MAVVLNWLGSAQTTAGGMQYALLVDVLFRSSALLKLPRAVDAARYTTRFAPSQPVLRAGCNSKMLLAQLRGRQWIDTTHGVT